MCRVDQITHFMFNNPPPGNRVVYEIMWKKFCRASQATDDMAHAHCMLDNYGYKHIRYVIRNCFSTVAMAAVFRYTYIACLVS
jgi:hypothetical protein